jgi:hypothetical protein
MIDLIFFGSSVRTKDMETNTDAASVNSCIKWKGIINALFKNGSAVNYFEFAKTCLYILVYARMVTLLICYGLWICEFYIDLF